VGGINMMLLPSTTAMFQKAGMLAPDGRCKALDATADGYVRAEAAAMMLLGLDDGEGGSAVAVLSGGLCTHPCKMVVGVPASSCLLEHPTVHCFASNWTANKQ
jgi:hypothetical protein